MGELGTDSLSFFTNFSVSLRNHQGKRDFRMGWAKKGFLMRSNERRNKALCKDNFLRENGTKKGNLFIFRGKFRGENCFAEPAFFSAVSWDDCIVTIKLV